LQKFITEFFNNFRIEQPEKGYRFSIDPFLLCFHVPPLEDQTVLDIGSGCGIIPLILKFKNPSLKVIGVEIQKELAFFARMNIRNNSIKSDIRIICRDIRDIARKDLNRTIDVIITNPPYKKKNSGRLSPDMQKSIARHEITINIKELILSCKKLLSPSGRLFIIFPAERVPELFREMGSNNIKPLVTRFIHTADNSSPRFAVVSAVNNGTCLPVTAPCVNISPELEIME